MIKIMFNPAIKQNATACGGAGIILILDKNIG